VCVSVRACVNACARRPVALSTPSPLTH
jgi:hypothetical protein